MTLLLLLLSVTVTFCVAQLVQAPVGLNVMFCATPFTTNRPVRLAGYTQRVADLHDVAAATAPIDVATVRPSRHSRRELIYPLPL